MGHRLPTSALQNYSNIIHILTVNSILMSHCAKRCTEASCEVSECHWVSAHPYKPSHYHPGLFSYPQCSPLIIIMPGLSLLIVIKGMKIISDPPMDNISQSWERALEISPACLLRQQKIYNQCIQCLKFSKSMPG